MRLAILFSISTGILFSSCSHHFGSISGGSAVITDSTFSRIQFGYGTSKTTQFLGLGGLSKDALVLEAKRNLYRSSGLRSGQAIGQTTLDIKRSYYGPVWTTKVTLSAEIIDFSASDEQGPLGSIEDFVNNRESRQFAPGDQVVYNSYNAQVLGFDKDKYVIRYFDTYNYLKTKNVIGSSLRRPGEITPTTVGTSELLGTPKNPTGELVRFRYSGKWYKGEVLEITDGTYLIRMERSNGERVGIYVPEKDVFKD